MRTSNMLWMVTALSLFFFGNGTLFGQRKADNQREHPGSRVPGLASKYSLALGRRMSTLGKEKTTYSGQFFNSKGQSRPVRIVHDISGAVRIEGLRDKDDAISFDGKNKKSSMKYLNNREEREREEDLLEVFVMDTVEGMMESMRNGSAVNFLGSGFGPGADAASDYKGPRYDIFDVATPVRCREDKVARSKRFYFDTNTGLLLSTRYYDQSVTPPVIIETRYSVWDEIDGSKYPARIQHYRDGKLMFDFKAEGIANEHAAHKDDY